MSLFREATLLFPYWSGDLINHDVYVNGVSMRSKLDETIDSGIGRVTGYYLAEKIRAEIQQPTLDNWDGITIESDHLTTPNPAVTASTAGGEFHVAD